jgi:4-amino-4-deoxy-L-arabinose transferase-like glycosyltransferase
MAYPDLLFSILTISLFYFFAKKYFSHNISLALTALLSVSFFAIRYSRFAMNTNSIPFWTLLFMFGILEMLDPKNKKNIFWPAVSGIALGVGIQLHALLLIGLPLLSFVILIIIIKRRLFTWRSLAIVILFLVALNIGPITYDFQYNGLNFHRLISSATKESGADKLWRNMGLDISYQLQANIHMISSLGDKNEARFIKIINRIISNKEPYATPESKVLPILGMILSLVFSLGGYFLLVYFFKKEQDQKKKDFLLLILFYSAVIFILMLPIIQEASLRYFIVLLFLPFVFLGLWINFLSEKSKRLGIVLPIFIITFLFSTNIFSLAQAGTQYFAKKTSSSENATLGELKLMLDYITSQSHSSLIYLTGNDSYVIRFYRPLAYLAKYQNIEIQRVFSDQEAPRGVALFGLNDTAFEFNSSYKNYAIKNSKKFNEVMILALEN